MSVIKLLVKFAVFLLVIMTASLFEEASPQTDEYQINLPKTVGEWTMSDSVQRIDSHDIFEYMDGAGELYLGYLFNHLDVYEYTADGQNSILVEIYFMKASDDAFGLLSLDWGGEPVSLTNSSITESVPTVAPSSRSLYGAGLLRIWSDNLYVRVMAFQETPESKEAVFSIGRAIVANRKNPSQPRLLKILSPTIGSEWILRKDRIRYFRSHLVLNSFYYLSHQNILNLDHSTEAVTAPYEKITTTGDRKRVQFLLVKYTNPDHAQSALDHFHETYLPEQNKDSVGGSKAESSQFYRIEDGWVGYNKTGRYIALVFECPDQETGVMIFNTIELNLTNLEDDHGK